MIKTIEVNNFKCYEDGNYFDLPGLTIVSGTNNSGKSSLLQSIYLITQVINSPYSTLNTDGLLNLGGFSEILNKNQLNSSDIEFGFKFDNILLKNFNVNNLYVNLTFRNPLNFSNLILDKFDTKPILAAIEFLYTPADCKEDYSIYLELVDSSDSNFLYKIEGLDEGYCKVNGIIPDSVIYKDLFENGRSICSDELDKIRTILSFVNSDYIKYIRAFRVENFSEAPKNHKGLGLSGEYTAEVINKYQNLNVDFVLDLKSNKKPTFSDVFNHWIEQFIGSDYKVSSERIDRDKFKIKIKEKSSSKEFTLNQVGFGISQLLPILTLLLTSKKDEIILIENPEVHLHPKLQSLFMDLCIFILKNNRKIVIETHSEHLVNKLRLHIIKDHDLINKCNILFFEKNNLNNIRWSEIEVTKEGRLTQWPKDFFDQTYKDMLGLIE